MIRITPDLGHLVGAEARRQHDPVRHVGPVARKLPVAVCVHPLVVERMRIGVPFDGDGILQLRKSASPASRKVFGRWR